MLKHLFTPDRLRNGYWLFLVLLATGCPQSDPANKPEIVPSPYAGVEVRLLVPAGMNLSESWTPALNDWADETDGSAEIVELDFSTVDERTLIERLSAKQPAFVLLPASLINSLVAENLVAAIPPEELNKGVLNWNSIPPHVRDVLGSLAGVPSMVPVTCPVPICCYRADLLEAAGREVPTSWDEYDALVAALPEWAPGLTAVEPWAEPFRVTTFLSRALSAAKHPAQYSVEFSVSNGEPLIDSAPFVKALSEVVILRPHLAKDIDTLSPDDCLRELREGRAAMGIVWEAMTPEAVSSIDRAAGKPQTPSSVPLTFAPLPGRNQVYDRETSEWVPPPVASQNRPALCVSGGLTICVLSTATAAQQGAAWDLWGLLETYQREGTILRLPGNSVMPLSQGVSHDWSGLSPEQWQQSRSAVTTSFQNPLLVCELPVFGQQQFRSQLSQALGLALDGEQTPAEALNQAARQWTTTIDELGRLTVLNSYRRRLGLSPRDE